MSPNVRESLDRRYRDQQHADAVSSGVVEVLAPGPSETNPNPKANEQIQNLDVAAQHYVVPLENNLGGWRRGKGSLEPNEIDVSVAPAVSHTNHSQYVSGMLTFYGGSDEALR